jgi:hypothetical protein
MNSKRKSGKSSGAVCICGLNAVLSPDSKWMIYENIEGVRRNRRITYNSTIGSWGNNKSTKWRISDVRLCNV